MAVVLVLGAKPRGQTSSSGPSTMATSDLRASVLWPALVIATRPAAICPRERRRRHGLRIENLKRHGASVPSAFCQAARWEGLLDLVSFYTCPCRKVQRQEHIRAYHLYRPMPRLFYSSFRLPSFHTIISLNSC